MWVTSTKLVQYIDDGYKIVLKNESKQKIAEFFLVDGIYRCNDDGNVKEYRDANSIKVGMELYLHTGYKIQPLGIKEFAYKQ